MLFYATVLQTWQIANSLNANCPLSPEYKYLLWANCHPKEKHKFTKVSCNNMHAGWTLFIKSKFIKDYQSPGKKFGSPRDLVDCSKLSIQCVWVWSTPPQRLIEAEVKWTLSSHLHSHSNHLKWQLSRAQWEQPHGKTEVFT